MLTDSVQYAHSQRVEDVVGQCETQIWGYERYSTSDSLAGLGIGREDDIIRKREEEDDGHGTFEYYRYVLGLQGTGKKAWGSSAEESHQRESSIAAAYGEEDVFYEIMKRNAEVTFQETRPETVNGRLHEKFMMGWYGQFNKSFLRELGYETDCSFGGVLRDTSKGRLVVGWKLGDPMDASPLGDNDDGDIVRSQPLYWSRWREAFVEHACRCMNRVSAAQALNESRHYLLIT